jgi:hypothetical protein
MTESEEKRHIVNGIDLICVNCNRHVALLYQRKEDNESVYIEDVSDGNNPVESIIYLSQIFNSMNLKVKCYDCYALTNMRRVDVDKDNTK